MSETHRYYASLGDQCEALVFGGAPEGERCLEPRTSAVHTDPEETAVITLPTFDGFSTGERPVVRSSFDAPAEDGGTGDGSSWSYDGKSPVGRLADMAESVPVVAVERTAPEAAAWALRNDEEVEGGPWQVRQYRLHNDRSREAYENLVAELTSLGETYSVWVWWVRAEVRMARVVWGSFATTEGGEVAAWVESWPE